MDLSQILQAQLQQQLGGGLMNVLQQQTGADRVQTAKASSAAVSALMGALARNASTPEGANALAGALERDHDGSLLDMLGGMMNNNPQQQAQRPAASGGLDSLLGGLMGGGGNSGSGGGLGDLLGSVLGGGGSPTPQQSQGGGIDLGGILGGLLAGKAGNPQVQEQIPPQFRKTLNGGGILKHVLGDRQEDTMKEVSQSSGLSLDKVGPLLTTLAPIVLGMLGKAKRENNLDAGGLSGSLIDMVTRSQQNPRQTAPDLGLAGALLDRDGDGSIMDDIAGMGASMLGKYFQR